MRITLCIYNIYLGFVLFYQFDKNDFESSEIYEHFPLSKSGC